ncbi:hypothetical protein [Amycolatopsis australiensis]|nr:hypothetical protein [Amycolatopsis australiensis]
MSQTGSRKREQAGTAARHTRRVLCGAGLGALLAAAAWVEFWVVMNI